MAKVKELLGEGADANTKDNIGVNGFTAIGLAAHQGHTEVLTTLIEHANGQTIPQNIKGETQSLATTGMKGAKVDLVDGYGYTPLMWAAWNGHVDSVKVLLASGAEKNKYNKHGEQSLHFAASAGQAEVLATLLAAGCKVNEQSFGGVTPLIAAVFYDGRFTPELGKVEAVKVLLAAGADESLQRKDGETAWSLAVREGLYEIKALLSETTGRSLITSGNETEPIVGNEIEKSDAGTASYPGMPKETTIAAVETNGDGAAEVRSEVIDDEL